MLLFYSAINTYQRTQNDSEVLEILERIPTLDDEIAFSVATQIAEFHVNYDSIFSKDKNYSAFSQEMYSIGNNFSIENDLYSYKNTMMILLGYQLIEQASLPVPTIHHFGNSYDANENNVLTVDLPNYFMPASFHYDKNVEALPLFEKFISHLPEYKGYITGNKNNIPTHLLFTPSEEQKKYIKEEFRKVKNHPESRKAQILSQMNGMANGRWQEFDAFISKEKQH